MTYKCIDITDALPIIEKEVIVVDIRDAVSYQTSHMQDAINLNNDNVEAFINNSDKATPVIVCCYHGNSSKGAAEYLAAQGFADVYSLNGGFSQWSAMYPEQCEFGA
ncbi:thiosulfate sulfurtransferase GlpE [Marinomonas mediterranea]|jgi:thiosulfate sulfurtransferase (EC 2.8.1.1)|uniref:Rhodanese-like protein n=1 Tax=Marinomonas mediterranea (strain ATCC 700492 / JCM 21426 / NBRC 103028 / MMB-1) TaxID=717774 RepID=F2K4J1_MARM1|nr:thiosulfate sulfurtransferase GlpE [Marinomonas mediterranea]ADZ90290.1 Rhodanese-like protein [Marinomonas mediterranea MMB-1]WCN08350.1 thiosulfate sulfurtransferase GlpE [Marinomonas mediterranea]WCN12407.1 thiosulfate sulfurtransferase GlpE [Marinomonas mediterranea]WCN16480.1 thiosulfate sulfurtransferase GlpE [Marinomonas mediterranea MMB-1]